jgi:hypothetical protein
MPSAQTRSAKGNLVQVLRQKSVWRELWLSVKRAHKDRRARRRLGFVSLWAGLLLLFVVAAIGYLAVLIGTGSIFFAPFVIPVLWWIRRRSKRDFEPMSIAPQAATINAHADAARDAAARSWLADLMLVYAVLVDRAGSERFLKEKELPANVEVTSRRVHMEILRSAGLWERMALKDRDVVMMPDGAWAWEQINRYATGIEPLRLLRWILRIDFRLPTVGQQLSGDFGIAHEIVVDPDRIRRGNQLIDTETVRTSRDDARTTLFRCFAEAISRGYQEAQDEKTADWAKGIAEELAGNQDEDFLLGDNLVSEASREQLGWATALANIRTDFLSMVLELLETGQPPDECPASIFAEEDESVPEPQ